jgi:penicillin-binding protein 1A
MAKRPAAKPKSKAKPKRSPRAAAKKAPGKKTARKSARAKKSRSPILWLLKWSLVGAIWSAVIIGVAVAWFAWGLPSIDGLEPVAAQTRRPGIVLFDTDGGRLASYGDLYGRRLSAHELPPHLIQAVVAIEDRRFFEHPGFDGRGLLRAIFVNLREGRFVQGGSTLTQQLAKNLFLTPERSIQRKIKELILALRLERRFEKDDLLSIYLNRVYLGAGTYGVEAASQRYFGV